MREDGRGVLSSLLGTVAGSLGGSIGLTAAPRAASTAELPAALQLLRLTQLPQQLPAHAPPGGAALCALALTRAGTLRLWSLPPPGGAYDGAPLAPPQLLISTSLTQSLPPGAIAGGTELLGGALLATCQGAGSLGIVAGAS